MCLPSSTVQIWSHIVLFWRTAMLYSDSRIFTQFKGVEPKNLLCSQPLGCTSPLWLQLPASVPITSFNICWWSQLFFKDILNVSLQMLQIDTCFYKTKKYSYYAKTIQNLLKSALDAFRLSNCPLRRWGIGWGLVYLSYKS